MFTRQILKTTKPLFAQMPKRSVSLLVNDQFLTED
jgi:alkylation response protein AidB-like acyl-CoA dehydrogenase